MAHPAPGASLSQLRCRVTNLRPIDGSGPSWGPYPIQDGAVETGDPPGFPEVSNVFWFFDFPFQRYFRIPDPSASYPPAWPENAR
ncbi:MAG: hypothetical protein ACP5I4_03760 [Oceanipulchritudo sp.]